MYKISEVAKLSKITVRTLHYYDNLGLLKPQIDNNGYRVYLDSDLLRLQQILFFRELDFTLKEKYGKTNAYKECEIKTGKYSKEKWEEIMKEANDIYIELANHMGEDPGSENVQVIIEKWRDHISENYYNCTIEIFKGLGEMYVCDARFTENINKVEEGLAEFLSKGIEIYCENNMRR